MKPIDIKTSKQIDFDVENNDIANRVRILKNKDTRSQPDEIFMIKNVKKNCTMDIQSLQSNKEKSNISYVKWKSYDNSFNTLIHLITFQPIQSQ